MRRYLVTGGLGFLGAPLVCALVRAGHRVRVLDNGSRGRRERLGDVKDDVELMAGDIRQADVVDRALAGTEAVCHLAFVNGTRHFYEQIEDFIDGLLRVIERGDHLAIYHIGTMEEIRIRELAEQIAQCLGLRVRVVPGREAVGGTERRCPDIRKLQALGFSPTVTLPEGLKRTVAWYAAVEAEWQHEQERIAR